MTTLAPTASLATFTAFADHRQFAAGSLADVAVTVKKQADAASGAATDVASDATVLVFDDRNGRVVDFDLRGTTADVVRRLPVLEAFLFPDPAKTKADRAAESAVNKKRGRGRPKLGVVGREVTLLPRHWEWLNRQPGGASVTLRKLVETARLAGRGDERKRLSRDAAYRFLSAMAGNLKGFEEASRAFFAGDRAKFLAESESWSEDVLSYALRLAGAWFSPDA